MLKFPFDRRIIQVTGLSPSAFFFFISASSSGLLFNNICLCFCKVALPKHHKSVANNLKMR